MLSLWLKKCIVITLERLIIFTQNILMQKMHCIILTHYINIEKHINIDDAIWLLENLKIHL